MTPSDRVRMRAMFEAFEGRRAKAERLLDDLGARERVIVSGGPRTGKSTLAVRAGERHKRAVRHADSLIGQLEWSEASEEVSRWLDEPGAWIVEGVSAPRAIRKWLRANPDKPLPATIVHFREPVQVQTDKQRAMAKGVETVWREILPELRRRGAEVIERDPAPTEPTEYEPDLESENETECPQSNI